MSTTSTNTLAGLLLEFFREMADAKEHSNFERDKDAFVFHMTDWESDLHDLAELFSRPDEFAQQHAKKVLHNLFYHVLPHLNAASEIYDDAPHIYKMLNPQKAELE